MKEQGEEVFVDKVLRIVNGELHQIERMLETMNSDEIQKLESCKNDFFTVRSRTQNHRC